MPSHFYRMVKYQLKMNNARQKLTIIGGGLAGCEAAWQASKQGVEVDLYEMRPGKMTEAHQTGDLAEIVCSNSMGSSLPDRPSGLLQKELELCGSLLLECARKSALPAGSALAVDRSAFSQMVSRRIQANEKIHIIREEVEEIPQGLSIIASGPLTSERLSAAITRLLGENSLFFYDAISPIVTAESIDMNIAFRASRFHREQRPEGDYINCPLNREEYNRFVEDLVKADRIPLKDYENSINQGIGAGKKGIFRRLPANRGAGN